MRFSPSPVEDEKYAQLLEKELQTPFEWITITDEGARQALEQIVTFMDEPLENPIHVGTYLMAKRARELGIKSVLTGDGSDEFFLGYQRMACFLNRSSRDPYTDYLKLLPTMKKEQARELYKEEVTDLMRPINSAYGSVVEPFKDIDQALLFERLEHLPEDHNMRLDRMTMAHGVEARVPFEDRRLVEFALQVPVATLFGTSGKEWLGLAAKPWVPREIIDRQKVHFPSLPNQWLRGKGAEWAADVLLDSGAYTRDWLKPNVLERYIKEHANNECIHGRLLWALISLELWMENLPNWRKGQISA